MSILPFLSLLCLPLVASAASEPAGGAEELVVEMTEVSVFEIKREADFVNGRRVECGLEPHEGVRYPEFDSGDPLFFVVELGDVPAAENGETRFFGALDESDGTATGFDRLYLDLDRDLDLTNQDPLWRWLDPPLGAKESWSAIVEQVCFERFELPCDLGEEGPRAIEILPRLVITRYEGEDEDETYRNLAFIATRAWRGELEVGGEEYVAFLGHNYSDTWRFDAPGTGLILARKDRPRSGFHWWGGDSLRANHELGGALYEFSATARGDRLTVRPYAGAFGELAIGAGGRELETMQLQGSLRSPERAVAVGEVSGGWPAATESCRVPVGDYLPSYLTIRYGALRISLSDNYHADGGLRGRLPDRVYGIEIREERPFVLDFTTDPTVLFASPAKEHRVKRGETLEVLAVLVDPKLDIMIRGLDDTSRQVEETVEYDDGESRTYETDLSLDPKVVITRADGEKVTEGDMPFG